MSKKKTFSQWVDEYGPERLALLLGLGFPAVNIWKYGRGSPRAKHLPILSELSGIDCLEIIKQTRRQIKTKKA